MPKTLRTELGLWAMYNPENLDWLRAGNSIEAYFDELDVKQGDVILAEDLVIEVCAVRVTANGYRAYVRLASALEELCLSTSMD